MANLKSTIKIETTTLFPNPVNFTFPVIEQVNLDAAFSTTIIPASTTETIYGATGGSIGTSEVVYLYVQADTSNTDSLTIEVTDSASNTAAVIKLLAGDFAWFPLLADGSGVQVDVINANVSDEQTINFIFAERG